MRALILVGGSAVLAALAGCVAHGPLIHPLGPGALGHSVEARQQVTVHYHGHTRSVQIALKVRPDDLQLIGLSAIGQRLFTLGWNGQTIERRNGLENTGHLPAQRILADLELAYWPLPALRSALQGRDLRLEKLGTTRALWHGNTLLWIGYRGPGDLWHSRLTVYNARAGYRLDVRPLAFNGHS